MAAAEDAPEDRQAQASVAVADANLAGGAGGTWVCCLPCGWLRRSRPVRRAALSAATLAVTSLLVASPVLFLSAAAPTNTPRHDCATVSQTAFPLCSLLTIRPTVADLIRSTFSFINHFLYYQYEMVRMYVPHTNLNVWRNVNQSLYYWA